MINTSTTDFWTTTLLAGKSAVRDYLRPFTLVFDWLRSLGRAVQNLSQLDPITGAFARKQRDELRALREYEKELRIFHSDLERRIALSTEPLIAEYLRSRQQLSALGRQLEDSKRENSQRLTDLQRKLDETNQLLNEFRRQMEDRPRKVLRRIESPYDFSHVPGSELTIATVKGSQRPRALLVRPAERYAMTRYEAILRSYRKSVGSLEGVAGGISETGVEQIADALSGMFALRSDEAHGHPMLLSPTQVKEGLEKLGISQDALMYLVLRYQALWHPHARETEYSW